MEKTYRVEINGETYTFSTPQEAEKSILEKLNAKPIGTWARVKFPLPKRYLSIKIIPENNREMIQITSYGDQREQGIVPRYDYDMNKEGLTASTREGKDNPYLCITVFPEDPDPHGHPVLCKGTCWVYSGNPGRVELLFIRAEPGLAKLIEAAEKRANEVINLALQSKF